MCRYYFGEAALLSRFPKYRIADSVVIGSLGYRVIRYVPIGAIARQRHAEFHPSHDPTVIVIGVDVIVRNMSKAKKKLPPTTLVSIQTMSGKPAVFEVAQFAGSVPRHLDSTVVLDPGEELRGVMIFNVMPPDSYLRVSDGDTSALIRLRGRDAGAPANDSTVAASANRQQHAETPAVDSPPVVISRVEPEFSEEARRAGWSGGTVRAFITIDEHGHADTVKVIDSPGMGIDDNVVAALRRWRFKPAIKNGTAVPSTATVTFTFNKH